MSKTLSRLPIAQTLLQKITSNQATVGIIGLGYVGLPLAHAMHQSGLKTIGFDIDPGKIRSLRRGANYLKHLGDELTQTLASSDRFEATTEFGRLGECDAVIVCVPTPLGPHREPDLRYVLAAAEDIGQTLRAGQLISLESTTYPRTTRDEFLPAILEARRDDARSLECGQDFFVAFSPEREDPGRGDHSTETISKLVGGLDDASTLLGVTLYSKGIQTVIPVPSAEIAESAKLLENIFRAVNIALINEVKVVLDSMNIDVWDVVRAASTKPFGYMPFFPGPGLGGHCIPIDPFYLTWKAKEMGQPTRFIELAGEINTDMPRRVVEKVMLRLNDRGKAIRGSKILVLGLAYKPNVDDSRESPSFELIAQMKELGAKVDYSDPHIPVAPRVRKHDLHLSSIPISPNRLREYDCVLVATHHDAFDWPMVATHSKLVVDTRDALRAFKGLMGERLTHA